MTEKILIHYKGRVFVREVCPSCKHAWTLIDGVRITGTGNPDDIKMFGVCLEQPCITFVPVVNFHSQEMTTEA